MTTPSKNLEKYIKELKQIFYLISTMQHTVDLKKSLNIMLKECITLTEATSGSIMFKHSHSNKLFFYATQNLDQETIEQIDMNIGDGIAGTVIAEGIPKIINNISLDPKYISINNSIHSEMAVPIKVKEKVLGVIILDHTNVNRFTDKHLELVQLICSNTEFIISNYIQTLIAEKSTRLLENILKISTTSSSQDIFNILTKELNATGTCIINEQGETFFQEGKMIEDITLSPKSFDKSYVEVLSIENIYKVPYTRIIIPLIKGNTIFIADKIYYFADHLNMDMKFAEKTLAFLASKDYHFHLDKTLSQWTEHKMAEKPGYVYDIAIGSVEKEIISAALKKHKDNKLKTAQFLGINRNTLRHKMEIHELGE